MAEIRGRVHGSGTVHEGLRSILNMRSIGFALIRSWVYLMFISAASSLIIPSENDLTAYAYPVSTVSLAATLLLIAAFGKQSTTQEQSRRRCIFAAAGTSVGTLCIILASLVGTLAPIASIVGGVLTGVGSGFIDMAYGEQYCRLESRKTNFEVPFAFFLAGVFFCLTMQMPPAAVCVTCSLIPVASSAILLARVPQLFEDRQVEAHEARIDIIPFALRIGTCACLVGIGDGIVRAVCLATPGLSMRDFYVFPLAVASVVTMVIIYVCCLITPPEQGGGLRKVYRSSVFVMAVFYLLLPLTQGIDFLESTLALIGYGTFNVLIWLLLAEIAHHHKLMPHVIFGIGWGMVTIGVLLGAIAGQLFVSNEPPLSVISLVATLCILTSYLFVLKESDIANIVTPADIIAFEKSDEEGERTNERADGDAASAAGSASRVLYVNEQSEQTEEASAPQKKRFMEGCDIIAEEFGLTPREKELMILYAKGRTSANIQQELYLSRGTVTTHLRHIYQKMDIHSKSELIDAIEERRSRQANITA